MGQTSTCLLAEKIDLENTSNQNDFSTDAIALSIDKLQPAFSILQALVEAIAFNINLFN